MIKPVKISSNFIIDANEVAALETLGDRVAVYLKSGQILYFDTVEIVPLRKTLGIHHE